MMDRNNLIQSVLSTLQDSEEVGVTLTDCERGSQINVFSGANINIRVTSIEKNESQTFNRSARCGSVAEEDRPKIYSVCHGIAKQYDIYPEMRGHMGLRWQTESMRELTNAALKELLFYMRGLQQRIQNVTSI